MRYEIKEMGLGDILDQAVALLLDHFKLLFMIALYLSIPISLIHSLAIYALMPDLNNPQTLQNLNGDMMVLLQIINVVFALILVLIVSPITNGATIYAISSEYLDQPATAGGSLKYALQRLGKLLGTNIYAGILIFLGTLALIIPGIYLAFRYWFTSHVVMIEDTSGDAALKRSGELMSGNMGKAFVLGFLLMIIGAVIGMIASFIPVQILSIIVTVFLQAILMIFGTAAGVIFYFSSRCKHENFDLTILADGVDAAPTQAEGL